MSKFRNYLEKAKPSKGLKHRPWEIPLDEARRLYYAGVIDGNQMLTIYNYHARREALDQAIGNVNILRGSRPNG